MCSSNPLFAMAGEAVTPDTYQAQRHLYLGLVQLRECAWGCFVEDG